MRWPTLAERQNAYLSAADRVVVGVDGARTSATCTADFGQALSGAGWPVGATATFRLWAMFAGIRLLVATVTVIPVLGSAQVFNVFEVSGYGADRWEVSASISSPVAAAPLVSVALATYGGGTIY